MFSVEPSGKKPKDCSQIPSNTRTSLDDSRAS